MQEVSEKRVHRSHRAERTHLEQFGAVRALFELVVG